MEANLVCRQTDKTNVHLAGITRRKCSCTNPRKVYQFTILCILSDFPPFDFSLACVNPPPQYLWPQPYSSWHESPFSVFEWLLCIGVCKAGLTHVIPSTWKFRLSGKFSLERLYESAGSLDFFFSFFSWVVQTTN